MKGVNISLDTLPCDQTTHKVTSLAACYFSCTRDYTIVVDSKMVCVATVCGLDLLRYVIDDVTMRCTL